jgi:hypothetical protein
MTVPPKYYRCLHCRKLYSKGLDVLGVPSIEAPVKSISRAAALVLSENYDSVLCYKCWKTLQSSIADDLKTGMMKKNFNYD